MPSLPIHYVLPELKETLQHHNRVVLQAPPGAGKTTALPLALLDAPWLAGRKIIMLEPRRLAVRTSASRMAEMLGEKVGERIGYQVKMDSLQSEKTQILIVTEGILTRKLQSDPALEDIALIIFDEFHERSLHADLSLALALESQSLLREDLKILVMSATLNTTALCDMLDAPLIESQGRSFPVTRHYLDANTPQPTKKELPGVVSKHIRKCLKEDEGNILVFLPGIREIKAVEKLLNADKPDTLHISPLYGNLSKEAQHQAIVPPPDGHRKVVLATNIAQTSLTIEGITVVIDSGLENVSVFNPFSGMNTLETRFISQDAATQRAGRAGRLQEGKAYHLWHKSRLLAPHDTPEILQADLTQLVLELALWGTDDMNTLTWMDTPPQSAVTHAKGLLQKLEAIDDRGRITDQGRVMASYPLHPRLAHMMLRAKAMGLGYEASLLASLLTEKDIYRQRNDAADLKTRVETLHAVANGHTVNTNTVDLKQCHYILANAKRIKPTSKATLDTKLLGVLLAFAYPERIAKQRHDNRGRYLLSSGKGAMLRNDTHLSQARFLVIADLDLKSRQATIYRAIEITQTQIEKYLPHLIETAEVLEWNGTEERVEARAVTQLGTIVLKASTLEKADSEAVTEMLLEEIEALGLQTLQWSKEAMALKARVQFLHLHGEEMPDLSDKWLLENMDIWLKPYIGSFSSLRECRGLNLHTVLLGLLSYEQMQTLDRLAPEKLQVPSGSRITIDYSNPKQPTLSVRLQEMFGTQETPTVLGGKIRLMLHLLSPAHRPMQVTQDLQSFWENTYDEVKKELRGKYKKHYWPNDPMEAQATNRTKKHM
ncbi:MAG: ATP-dependent helicase HrpB [Sulfurovum sp.]|nr:ATP-dependent helicase HrpB [Sulfurovum sp.]